MRKWIGPLVVLLLACSGTCGVSLAMAEEYPARPIKLVVPFAPGGAGDISARIVADATGALLGKPFIIENRPGAGAVAASQSVISARPDGYTLLLIGNVNAIGQSMIKSIRYDIVNDVIPISTLVKTDVAVFAAKSSPLSSVRDLIEQSKRKPNSVNVGVGLYGTTQHLTAELFKSATGLDATIVPFRSSAELVTAVRGGDVDVGFELLAPVLSALIAGEMKPIAVSASKRSPYLPATPTLMESGIPLNVTSWSLIAAPARTPELIITRLNQAISDALARPDVQQKLQPLSVEVVGGTPAEARQLLVSEIAKWKQVIEAAKISPD